MYISGRIRHRELNGVGLFFAFIIIIPAPISYYFTNSSIDFINDYAYAER